MAGRFGFLSGFAGGLVLAGGMLVGLSIAFPAPTVDHVAMAGFTTESSPLVQPQTTASSQNATFNVPLVRDERALILNATLDGQEPVRFLLDTGATYTAISSDLAQRLGYDTSTARRVTITTANGMVSFPKVVLKSVTLNGYTAHNVEATVMPLPRQVPFSGLLGLNFVKHHRITIDAEADRLVIEPHRAG